MEYILVSACLLGENCKYSGGSNRHEPIIRWREKLEKEKKAVFIPVCPEVMGGLATPRMPAEICGERVVTKDGRDVTAEYQKGAEETLKILKRYPCLLAILKERSPSCGTDQIYDGSFAGKLIKGDGITAGLLRQNGIFVAGESKAEEILKRFLLTGKI